jgi:hypothetical protein
LLPSIEKGRTVSNRRFIFRRLIHCHEVKISTNAIGKRLERMLGVWQKLPSACSGVQVQPQISGKEVIHGHETSCRPQGFY